MQNHLSQILSEDVCRSAALLGLRIYVLGSDLQVLGNREVPEALQSEVTLAISIRGPTGEWPISRESLKQTLNHSTGVQDIYVSRIVPKESNANDENLMLLFMLLNCGRERPRLDVERYRFLWLEESIEIVIEPSRDIWNFDLDAGRLDELCGKLVPESVDACQTSNLPFVRMYEERHNIREAQWCPVGPLAENEIAMNLVGVESSLADKMLRFAME